MSKVRLLALQARAKEMRNNPTEPEKRLWRSLSNSQLKGYKFRRQSVVGNCIVDFLCPKKSLIIKVDGDTHDQSEDRLRDQELEDFGYRVLRVTNADVINNKEGVLELIANALRIQDNLRDVPHPNPSPKEEGLKSAANALREAARVLQGVSDTARLDAELILAHALGISRDALLLDMPKLIVPESFQSLIERRLRHEPVAHIVGTREFWGLDFQVSSDVLIPRPDSETLIEEAARIFAGLPPANILDLGTGSGALLLAALSEFPQAKGTGIDASVAALAIAHNNADSMGLSDRAAFVLQDWTQDNWTQAFHKKYDLILANPPYVSDSAQLAPEVHEFEPHQALFAGKTGMDDYDIIIPALAGLLTKAGVALIEIGFDQREPVSNLSRKHGYAVENKQDLGGNDRLLILRQN